MSRQDQAPFVVVCPDCDVRKRADEPNEAVAFYRRHHSLTGHDIEWERADLDVLDALPDEPGDLRGVIDELASHYPEGVPIGVVAAAMDGHGLSIGETMDAIHELRMRGALYEPRDDHLRAT